MDKPHVEIIEQPASKALRFRYQCEGRSAGSIPGVNSTTDVKTYPSIQIVGYKGPAIVLVSCVTKDPPYRPHPHNLVGREGCNRGVCVLEIPQDTMSISFSNLGIQCVKKKDIAEHLDVRQAHKVDPFRTGFQHKNQPTSIDLNVVRLCFQVFIQNLAKGDKKCTMPLPPVVSDPIYDKKAMCDLTIVKLSDCVSAVDGGRKDIILLCEKVTKEDIEVRFYEEQNGQVTWEARGDFQPSQVHKQTAIWFRAPRYHRLDITEPVRVCIQLRRPSDGATSEPLPFEMLPLDSGLKRKRKLDSEPNINVLRPLQEHMQGNSKFMIPLFLTIVSNSMPIACRMVQMGSFNTEALNCLISNNMQMVQIVGHTFTYLTNDYTLGMTLLNVWWRYITIICIFLLKQRNIGDLQWCYIYTNTRFPCYSCLTRYLNV